jgi:hypothetical protein
LTPSAITAPPLPLPLPWSPSPGPIKRKTRPQSTPHLLHPSTELFPLSPSFSTGTEHHHLPFSVVSTTPTSPHLTTTKNELLVSPRCCRTGMPCHPRLHRLLLPHLSFFPTQVTEIRAVMPLAHRRSTAESRTTSSSWVSYSAAAYTSSIALSCRALHCGAATPLRRRRLSVLATTAKCFLLPLHAGPATLSLEARPECHHSLVTRPTGVAPLPSFFRSSPKLHHLPMSSRRLLRPW